MSKKKVKPIIKLEAVAERIKNPYVILPARPLPFSPSNGENSVEFNQYNVVYSNNVSGNFSSPWRAGITEIGCYMDGDFVGAIVFYETAENMNGGYIDPHGVITVEYPIGRFEDIMRILQTFSNLYLLFVEKDNDGTPLAHPVGAVMTFQKKTIGE